MSNMYPLNEINQKMDKILESQLWQDEIIDKIDQTAAWLMHFAKEIKPKLDQLEIYADLVPGFQAVAADLKVENERLKNRQNNTAIVYGKVATINPGANPPRIEVHSSTGNKFIAEIPEELFDAAMLKIGLMIRIEARIKNHTIKRGTFTIFYALKIEVINSGTVDKVSENGYNDN